MGSVYCVKTRQFTVVSIAVRHFSRNSRRCNAWPISLKLIQAYIKSIDIKDFQWAKKEGKWVAEVVPLGEGLVDYKSYLNSLKLYGINVPISMHYEYPLGGAEHGGTSLTIDRNDVIKSMQTDLNNFKVMLRTAGVVK